MSAANPSRAALEDGDVMVVDETSMLTASQLNFIAYRLMQILAMSNTDATRSIANTDIDPFEGKHVILVGDLAQVSTQPPQPLKRSQHMVFHIDEAQTLKEPHMSNMTLTNTYAFTTTPTISEATKSTKPPHTQSNMSW